MLTNIDIDEAVVAEAMRLTGARSKREIVDRALRELVARANRPSVRALFGIGGVDPDYDPKAFGTEDAEVGRFRVQEPAAPDGPGSRAGVSPPTPAKGARRRGSSGVARKRPAT